MGWLEGLIYKDGGKKQTDNKTPASEPKVEPLVTGPVSAPPYNNTPPYNAAAYSSNNNAAPASVYQPINYTSPIPPEEMEKCKTYFGKLLTAAREQNKSYNQFLASMETVSKTDPNQPIATVVKLAFGFLKMQNPALTKDSLLLDMNNAMSGIINDKTTDFKAKQEKRQKEGVDDNNKMLETKMQQIQQKQLEIQKLNEEITQLQSTVGQNKQVIEMKNTCYDVVSSQVINRVKEEIGLVTNYIR